MWAFHPLRTFNRCGTLGHMTGLEEDLQIAVPTVAAAFAGAVLAALILLGWPSPAVLDWMRVRQIS